MWYYLDIIDFVLKVRRVSYVGLYFKKWLLLFVVIFEFLFKKFHPST